MAFLLVRAVKQGYQAHCDFNSPTPTEERLDRRGRPKKTGAVYNMVQSAERAYQQRQQRQQRQQQQQNGASNHRDQSQSRQTVNDEGIACPDVKLIDNEDDTLDVIDAPPSYDAAISSPAHTQSQSRGINKPSGFGNAFTATHCAYAPPTGPPPLLTRAPESGPVGTFLQGHAAQSSNRQRDSSFSSSSSSSSSDSSRDYQQNNLSRGLTRDQYRAQKREYKLARKQFKRDLRESKRHDREEYRVRKRESRRSIFGIAPADARS